MNLFGSKQKDIDAAWKGNKAAEEAYPEQKGNQGGAFVPVPAGEYSCQLIEVDVDLSKKKEGKTQRLQAKMVWKVLEGEQKGKRIWVYHGLDDDTGRYYFGLTIGTLTNGTAFPNSVADSKRILEELVGAETCAQVAAVEKGDFTNYYVNELLSGGAGSDEPPAAPAAAPAAEESQPLQAGHRVEFKDREGKVYNGTVVKVKKTSALVDVDDMDQNIDVPIDRLTIVIPDTADDGVPENPETAIKF